MASSTTRDNRWPVIAVAWGVVAALLLVRTILQFGAVPLLGDSDDAMRIATAAGLLDGQGWYDIVQHRDNAPFGADLHWSRLIDAPIAALIAIVRPVAGAAGSDVAATLWPLILLLPLLALSAALVRRLVPDSDEITALALPVISLVLLIEFLPGRVDHHNVQILLMLGAALAMLVWRDRALGGAVAGLVFATSLAIGFETLPFLAVAIVALAALWAVDPERYWPAATAFGVALAAGTLIHFLIAVAPARYTAPACDMISIAYVVAAGFGGLSFAAVAALAAPVRLPEARFTIMVVAGGAVALICALAFPACLAGPYGGVNARVAETVFRGIAEVQPFWQRLNEDPATGVAFGFPALVALVIALRQVMKARGGARVDWLIAGGFLVVSIAVMMVQIRGARFAAAFAIPPAALLISGARSAYLTQPNAVRMVGLLGSWLLFAGVLQFALVGWLVPRSATAAPSPFADVTCFRAADYEELAALPPGIVMAPIRIGAHVLRYTPHSVVSAGFHRNNAGTLAVLDFFGADDAAARAIAAERTVDYVADCAGANATMLAGRQWLTALPSRGTLSLYSVDLSGGV